MAIHIFTKKPSDEQIVEMLLAHNDFIKLAVDISTQVIAGGGAYHADCEELLLAQGSIQQNIWGGDWVPDKKGVLFGAMINMRPSDGNRKYEIVDPALRKVFEGIVRSVFDPQ